MELAKLLEGQKRTTEIDWEMVWCPIETAPTLGSVLLLITCGDREGETFASNIVVAHQTKDGWVVGSVSV